MDTLRLQPYGIRGQREYRQVRGRRGAVKALRLRLGYILRLVYRAYKAEAVR